MIPVGGRPLLAGVVAALDAAERVVVVDPAGRRQWACVRLRAAELDAAIRAAGDVSDGSLRALLGRLDLDEVVLSRRDCADLDTPDDVKEYGDEHR